MATACADCIIRVYDIQTRKLKHSLEGHSGSVDYLEFTSNTIVSGSADK